MEPLAGTTPHSLSILGMFMTADPIVQIVMLMLVAASIWCWAIILDKALRLRRMRAAADDFEEAFWSGGSLDQLYEKVGAHPRDPLSATFAAGMREWRHANERGLVATGAMKAGLQQRIERVMSVTIMREMVQAERYLTVLANVGSVAPFLGLFGTVIGIMNSFNAIAATNNTSLAVVAPGIAEALFATALGLFAAIPAVVAYNKFSTDLGRFADRLDSFSTEFSAILSRHLEERG